MGFFRNNDLDYDAHDSVEAVPHSKLYSSIMWTSIIGIFVLIAVIVLGITRSIHISSGIVLFLSILLIFCAGLISILPWIRYIEKKEHKILAFIFLGFTALCVVLWITCAILIYTIYKQIINDQVQTHLGAKLVTFQICLAITLQFVVASIITTTNLKYKNKWLPFQIIMYVGYIFIDFILTFSLCCVRFNMNDFNFELSNAFSAVITNKITLVLLVLAVLYTLIANSIIYRSNQKKAKRNLFKKLQQNDETPEKKAAPPEKSSKEKLEDLKKMFDEGIITEDEFKAKKEEILKDF